MWTMNFHYSWQLLLLLFVPGHLCMNWLYQLEWSETGGGHSCSVLKVWGNWSLTPQHILRQASPTYLGSSFLVLSSASLGMMYTNDEAVFFLFLSCYSQGFYSTVLLKFKWTPELSQSSFCLYRAVKLLIFVGRQRLGSPVTLFWWHHSWIVLLNTVHQLHGFNSVFSIFLSAWTEGWHL